VLSALEYEQLRDYRYWNLLSEKEYLQKAHENIDTSQNYSIEEVDAYLERIIESYES
jgi:hypothetical protein